MSKAVVELKNKVHKKEAFINTLLVGEFPDWKGVREACNMVYPNFEVKFAEPGEVLEGEETPMDFKGLYSAREYDQANFQVASDARVAWNKGYVARNPLREGEDPASWDKRRSKQEYRHFRGLVIAGFPEYIGCRIGLIWEQESTKATDD